MGADEMAQLIKPQATKMVPRTHMVEREPDLPKAVLWLLHVPHGMSPAPQTHRSTEMNIQKCYLDSLNETVSLFQSSCVLLDGSGVLPAQSVSVHGKAIGTKVNKAVQRQPQKLVLRELTCFSWMDCKYL